MTYTDEQLRNLTVDKLRTLYENAKNKGGDAGAAIVARIDELGLPLSTGGMPFDHPEYREMAEVVWSKLGRAAAVTATEKGLPAMAGVDPLLQQKMGARYNADQQKTMTAGSLVGEIMRHLGYAKDKESAPMPQGCIAKTAATWKPVHVHKRAS